MKKFANEGVVSCSRGHQFYRNAEHPTCPTCWPGRYRKQAAEKEAAARAGREYELKAKVWLYPGNTAWHFVSVPKGASARMKEKFGEQARGWGSLPVQVTLGGSTWKTSIFPDKKRGVYLLPLKASVRKQEGIRAGDAVSLFLNIRV